MSCSSVTAVRLVVLCSFLLPVCTSFRASTPIAYDMQYMTSPEVCEYVKLSQETRGCAPIIIPIGATEQHGPTGLIGTDILTASAVATEVATLEGCLLGPPISIGMSLHHCGFPGSVSLRPSTLAAVICDVVWSLQQSSNITHFLFVNGHGGNVLALDYARYLLATRPSSPWEQQMQLDDAAATTAAATDSKTAAAAITPTTSRTAAQISIVSWYANSDSQILARKFYGDSLGQHATPDEVAITQHIAPQAFEGKKNKDNLLNPENLMVAGRLGGFTKRRRERVTAIAATVAGGESLAVTGVASYNPTAKVVILERNSEEDAAKEEREAHARRTATALSYMCPDDYKRRFPDGRMWSNPGLATAAHGQQLLQTAVLSVAAQFRDFVTPEQS
ncbi:Creatininase-like domain-containing protein [Ochromonadaceae sp. CCMP2298]|nr:Creatininase-like domain-containing protein [Ochromonadaceae sp. CCMP2298]